MPDASARRASKDFPFEKRADPFSGASSAVSEPLASETSPAPPVSPNVHPPASKAATARHGADRRWGELLWYRFAQCMIATLLAALGGWRASGRNNMPATGAVLLVANHLSFLDVLLLGIPFAGPSISWPGPPCFFPSSGSCCAR